MKVPFLDLGFQYRAISDSVEENLKQLLFSGSYVLGANVRRFEAEFAAFVGVEHAVGVANGTDALRLALQALNVGPGDEVVAPLHTFKATIASIVALGATPVLVDLDLSTGSPTIEHLCAAVSPRTRAIVVVHMHGYPYPVQQLMGALGSLAIDVPIVEDASQAHGAKSLGKVVGSLGTVAAFSLYPGKNLGAVGDAGIVTTDSAEVQDRIRALRSWTDLDYFESTKGASCNSRLDEIQALILSAKLRHLSDWNATRYEQAMMYRKLLPPYILWPAAFPGSVFHHLVCLVPRRDEVRKDLAEAGIETGVHYSNPVSNTVLMRKSIAPFGTEAAESVALRTISLPVGPHLDEAKVKYVANSLNALISR